VLLHGQAREEAACNAYTSALQQGMLQNAIKPFLWRQNISTPSFIAKRHKTVRTFFDVF
jgi:hypothetical protein